MCVCKDLSIIRLSLLDPAALFKALGIVNETGRGHSQLAVTHTDAHSVADSMTGRDVCRQVTNLVAICMRGCVCKWIEAEDCFKVERKI